MIRFTALTLVLAAVALSGCGGREAVPSAQAFTSDSVLAARRSEAARARQDSIVRSRPGYIIDSILPVEEEIRRFQATLGPRPTGFTDGATSRTALVKAFVRALERRDTIAVARLVVNREEFGYLVYPTSPNVVPPYRLSPDLVWMSRAASTHKGVTRLFARYGGRPLGYVGYSCPDTVTREGPNALWSPCSVSRRTPTGGISRLRMFGPIIARDGRYKFLSLSNGL